MGCKLEPFKAEHFDQSNILPISASSTTALANFADHLKLYEKLGPGFTLFNPEGQVIGSAGIVILWSGVGEAWSLLTTLVKQYPKAIFKAVKDYLDHSFEIHGLNRVQSTCRIDDEDAKRWLRHLGFEMEGVMKAYGLYPIHGLNRVQSTCRIDDEDAKRWLRHLGFEMEGVMKAYGPDGETYIMWGRTR